MFGVVGTLADKRVSELHYRPLILTRDAEHPPRWGRAKVQSLREAGYRREGGIGLCWGPTSASVSHLMNSVTLPDPTVFVVLAQQPIKSDMFWTTIMEMEGRGQTIRLLFVEATSAYDVTTSNGRAFLRPLSVGRDDYGTAKVVPMDIPEKAPEMAPPPPKAKKKKATAKRR